MTRSHRGFTVRSGTSRAGTKLSGPRLETFLQLQRLERQYLNDQDKADLCARVKQARIQAGLEQSEIGEMLDPPVEDRTIRNYESFRPPFKYLRQWAEITGVSYEWLLRGDQGLQQLLPTEEAIELGNRLDRIEQALEKLVARLEPPERKARG